jgi:hypothetical protein
MTTFNRENNVMHARCSKDDHDLVTRQNGQVFCSNPHCKFNRTAHKTGPHRTWARPRHEVAREARHRRPSPRSSGSQRSRLP